MSENATVAHAATLEREIPLDRMVLIGTFGTEDAPRALVRHATGRIEKVAPGERLSGSEILAIGAGELLLKKGGGVRKLVMPAG